jgi:hypothetical protein
MPRRGQAASFPRRPAGQPGRRAAERKEDHSAGDVPGCDERAAETLSLSGRIHACVQVAGMQTFARPLRIIVASGIVTTGWITIREIFPTTR